MIQILYKNYLINTTFSYSGKTKYFRVWKLDEEGDPFDIWGDSFQSIRQAKTFIDMETVQ